MVAVGDKWVSPCGTVTIHCGPWADVLSAPDETWSLITDPPYSQRTHRGHDEAGNQIRSATGERTRRALDYLSLSVDDFASWLRTWFSWKPLWSCAIVSHDMIPCYEQSSLEARRYPFAPVPVIQRRPRLLGDGPANWAAYLMASRLRSKAASRWRCLPGIYESVCEKNAPITGAKPLNLMRAIVCDYSNRGSLVVDPCAGWGTTLLAAAMEGRRAIGAEIDPETFSKTVERLSRGWTVALPFDSTGPMEQTDMY